MRWIKCWLRGKRRLILWVLIMLRKRGFILIIQTFKLLKTDLFKFNQSVATLHSPIVLRHGLSYPIVEWRDPREGSGISSVTDWVAKGHSAHEHGVSLGIGSHHGTATVTLTSTLRVLFKPLGADDRVSDHLRESLLTLGIADHLQTHFVQIIRGGTVGAQLPEAGHCHCVSLQGAPLWVGITHYRDLRATGDDWETEQGQVIVVWIRRILRVNDAVIRELGVAHAINVDPSQAHLGSGIGPRKAVTSSDYPKWVNKGSTAGPINTSIGVVLVNGRLPRKLSRLGQFPSDNRRVNRVIARRAGGGGVGGRVGVGLQRNGSFWLVKVSLEFNHTHSHWWQCLLAKRKGYQAHDKEKQMHVARIDGEMQLK